MKYSLFASVLVSIAIIAIFVTTLLFMVIATDSVVIAGLVSIFVTAIYWLAWTVCFDYRGEDDESN